MYSLRLLRGLSLVVDGRKMGFWIKETLKSFPFLCGWSLSFPNQINEQIKYENYF